MGNLSLCVKGKIIVFLTLLMFYTYAWARQSVPVDFIYPVFTGDFYVSGKIAFPPGVVAGENNIIVTIRETGVEIDSCIVPCGRWPDGSLSFAQVTFSANQARPAEYLLSYGPDIKRKKIISETAVLPTIPFALPGMPRQSQNLNVPVGQINVLVDKSSDIVCYWYFLPMLLLLWVSFRRNRRVCK